MTPSFCYPRDAEKLEEEITMLKAQLKAEQIVARACQKSLKLLTEIVEDQSEQIKRLQVDRLIEKGEKK